MFKRKRGHVVADFQEEQAEILRRLIRDYLGLLDARSGDAWPENDPVLGRLFPAASRSDPEVAEQYRALAGSELDIHKREVAGRALAGIGESGPWKGPLEEDDAEAWMQLLADLRLAVGVRIDVTEEMMAADIDPTDLDEWPVALIHYLGGLQQDIVEALQI